MLPVAAALVAGWTLMAWPWLSGNVTIPWDAKAHFLPQIQFLAQSLGRGEWPLWTPNVFSGHPQVADPQSMLFSPPILLLALVNAHPSAWAVDVTVLLAGLTGSLALAVWMRDRDWHWAGALIGGLAFMFGASMAWRLQHTGQVLSLAYWPLAMLCLDRSITRRSYRWGAATGLVGAFILLGRDQVALLVLYVLAAQALWRLASEDDPRAAVRAWFGPMLAAAIVGAAIVAVPLTLTALFAAESNRPAIDYHGAGRGSLHPALLLTFLMPQIFGAAGRMEEYWGPPSFAWNDTGLFIAQNMGQLYLGALPALLMLLSLFRGDYFTRDIRFFGAAFLVLLAYALGWYTPLFRIAYELFPGVKFYRRPADATFLIGGLGAILAGYAAHALFTRPWRRIGEMPILLASAIVVLAFVSALGLGLWLDRVGLLWQPLSVAACALALAAIAISFVRDRIILETWPMALLLAGLTTADLAWNNGPSTSSAWSPAAYDAFEPDTRNATVRALKSHLAEASASDTSGARRDRMEFLGVGFHWPNVSLSQGFENTLGYNPVRLGLYSRATGAEDHVGMIEQRKLTPLMPSYRSHLADLLGLRFVAAGKPLETIDTRLRPGDYRLVARTEHAALETGKTDSVWIYENPRALPRVLLVSRADGIDAEALLRTGEWPKDFDPTRMVLLEGDTKVVYSTMGAAEPKPSSARIVAYRNTEVVVETDSARGGWLVLNDPWHPWWFATVDGTARPILRANVMFRAVELAPGKHRVVFRFRPLLGAWRQVLGS
jgi:hypothetical protein